MRLPVRCATLLAVYPMSPFLAVFFALPVVGLVLGILTAIDVSKYPEWAFGQTGASKTVWQVVPVLLGFFCLGIGGIVMYLMWVSSKRAAVSRVAQSGPPPYFGYGAPPGYGGPPGWPPPPGAGGWSAPPPSAPPVPPAQPPQ